MINFKKILGVSALALTIATTTLTPANAITVKNDGGDDVTWILMPDIFSLLEFMKLLKGATIAGGVTEAAIIAGGAAAVTAASGGTLAPEATKIAATEAIKRAPVVAKASVELAKLDQGDMNIGMNFKNPEGILAQAFKKLSDPLANGRWGINVTPGDSKSWNAGSMRDQIFWAQDLNQVLVVGIQNNKDGTSTIVQAIYAPLDGDVSSKGKEGPIEGTFNKNVKTAIEYQALKAKKLAEDAAEATKKAAEAAAEEVKTVGEPVVEGTVKAAEAVGGGVKEAAEGAGTLIKGLFD